MKKTGFFISITTAFFVFVLPVQAFNYCGHPVSDPVFLRDYERNSDQHCLCQGWAKECRTCGEIFDIDLQNEDWEDHDWDIDWDHPDIRDYGVVYDAWCTVCGYEDSLINP